MATNKPAEQAREKAQDAATQAAAKAEGAKAAVGRGMESMADTIREQAPQQGVLGGAATAVADQMDRAGLYLQAYNFQEMGRDLVQCMRKAPVATLLAGIGLGFLLGRAVRS